MDSDEDTPKLSSHALAALQSFLDSQKEEEERFQQLQAQAESQMIVPSISHFKEDWQLSQFWYSDETSEMLAKEVESTCPKGLIACISCPTLYFHLAKTRDWKQDRLRLLEHDDRFAITPGYTRYDYNHPLQVPNDLINAVDMIIVDPPFLSEECWEKFVETIQHLLKPNGKILACTGLIMTGYIKDKLDLKLVEYEPTHANGLSNEFGCFVNYSSSFPFTPKNT